ncbi:MAG TPA: thioesterase family protein [Longimicrobium sp.]|nr:thioesterase family protein [Longimicrobium sp.]
MRVREGAAFECRFEVRWDDLDGNRHVRNTAFSEYATHTRFRLLGAHGFSQARLEALRFGPVMMREEIRYRREVLFGDEVVVDVRCAGLSADSSHWRVHQDVRRSDGREAAVLTIQGGWLDLDARKLVAPPAELAAVLLSLPRTHDFEELPSLIRRRGGGRLGSSGTTGE